MAHQKHWAVSTDDPTAGRKFRLACGMRAWINSAKDSGPPWSLCGASVYRDMAACDPDWYCSDCAKAARLALAAESAPKADTRTDSDRYGELRALVEAWQLAVTEHWPSGATLDDNHVLTEDQTLYDWKHR